MGQTVAPKRRWAEHRSISKNINKLSYQSHLYAAMNKYGVNNFTFEVVEQCDADTLEEREKEWIIKLSTLEPNGYNILKGGCKLYGENNPFFGKKHSFKTKRRISEKIRVGKPRTKSAQ